MVIARFLDGRVEKGTTRDFSPTRPSFHLFPGGDESLKSIEIEILSLKALFFVKTFHGDATRDDLYDFETVRGQGRRVAVTFDDGETVAGYTMGYSPNKPGFFVIPADRDSNNERIYVVNHADVNVNFLAAGSAFDAA